MSRARPSNDTPPELQLRLLAGPHAVGALVHNAPKRIERLWYARDLQGSRLAVVRAAEAAGVVVEPLTSHEMNERAGDLKHQGLVARARPAPLVEWAALLHPSTSPGLVVAFDQVTDPHNLGAVLRSAESFGATGALVTVDRCAQPNPTVARISAGASELLPIAREVNLARALQAAADAGYLVVGADLDGDAPWMIDLTGPMVLVIGAEGTGLRPSTRAVCSRIATLPRLGRTESLNASAAAAALLSEIARQRAQST